MKPKPLKQGNSMNTAKSKTSNIYHFCLGDDSDEAGIECISGSAYTFRGYTEPLTMPAIHSITHGYIMSEFNQQDADCKKLMLDQLNEHKELNHDEHVKLVNACISERESEKVQLQFDNADHANVYFKNILLSDPTSEQILALPATFPEGLKLYYSGAGTFYESHDGRNRITSIDEFECDSYSSDTGSESIGPDAIPELVLTCIAYTCSANGELAND
jgi:hypothetical protein